MKTTIVFGISLLLAIMSASPIQAAGPLDEEGRVVDFARDVAPILRAKCIKCHGPETAKNDFRVDDPDVMADYIDAGDAESSSLYIDYVVTDDADMLMPPPSAKLAMTASEVAVLRLWLDEGAHWPEDAKVVLDVEGEEAEPVLAQPVSAPRGLGGRIWAFQGYLHPAVVHFPVALLTFGAVFVALGFKWPQLAHPIPFACLLFGAVSAVAASAMGWSFAEQQGFGSWTKGLDSAIARHRWAGILVTVASVIFALIAVRAEVTKSPRLRRVWQIGLLLCAALVGLVGHVGGELTYGEEFYQKAFEILRGIDPELAGSEPLDSEL